MPARIDSTPFPRPAWLPGGHLQTIHAAHLATRPRYRFIRHRAETLDGDFIDFDWTAVPSGPIKPGSPALLLFHGLEGSSNSSYAQTLAQTFHEHGWIVAIAHFRGCSGTPNRLARAYHSGDTADVAFMIDTVKHALPHAHWHLAGVSLGGNAMLRYLGEEPGAISGIHAAAAISSPMDLVACGHQLSRSLMGRWLYTPHFLRTMKTKMQEKARQFPDVFDSQRVAASRTLHEFDDAYTAPVHGFRDVLDYWTRASSKPVLKRIQVPTLILNARNDPFVPAWSLPEAADCSDQVVLHQPRHGGHVGFVTGRYPGHLGWLAQRLLTFFESA